MNRAFRITFANNAACACGHPLAFHPELGPCVVCTTLAEKAKTAAIAALPPTDVPAKARDRFVPEAEMGCVVAGAHWHYGDDSCGMAPSPVPVRIGEEGEWGKGTYAPTSVATDATTPHPPSGAPAPCTPLPTSACDGFRTYNRKMRRTARYR